VCAGRNINPRHGVLVVFRGVEVDERLVEIDLRRLMVEAQAEIKGKTAIHFPVILEIPFRVPVLHVESCRDVVLAVSTNVAEEPIRVARVRVQERNRAVRVEVKRSVVVSLRWLELQIVLQVNAGLEGVIADYLA